MLYIHYDPIEGEVCPDGVLTEHVDAYVAITKDRKTLLGMDTVIRVGSELLINELRVRVVRGELEHDDIQFIFVNANNEKEVILCSEVGSLTKYPPGFCDRTLLAVRELGKARRKQQNQEVT
jgi:hypothetical protein